MRHETSLAHPLTEEDRRSLQAGLKAAHGIIVRRAQIILLSAEQQLKAAAIGQQLGLSAQWVRQVLHAFNAGGASLEPGRRALHDDQRALNDAVQAYLRDLIRQSPREHGYDTRLWTLAMLADLCYQKGLTAQRVHPDTIRQTLMEMDIPWSRAKYWINSPDEHSM